MNKLLSFVLSLIMMCALTSTLNVKKIKADEAVLYGCNDIWYEFEKTSEETVLGEPIKASPDFNTENVLSGVIEASMECTVTAYINATLDYTAEKFIKTSLSASWTSSATYRNKVSYSVGPNKRGYMAFIPRYTENFRLLEIIRSLW